MQTKEQLRAKIRRLELQVRKLRKLADKSGSDLAVAKRHQRNSTGSRGERFLLRKLRGAKASGVGNHDLLVRGKRIEVKTALCRRVHPNRKKPTQSWTWHRPLGFNNDHKYEYLILLGVKDTRFGRLYEQPTSAYVIFLIPWKAVHRYWGKTNLKLIHLMTEPGTGRSKMGTRLWNYEVSFDELKKRLRA